MAVEIIEIRVEHCENARLIGKKYMGRPNWGEWWANDWFAAIEQHPRIAFNSDAYIGAAHSVNGVTERFIGEIFPGNTPAPEGFEAAELPETDYVVCYLRAKEGSGDFYTAETHAQCIEAIKAQGLKPKADAWCIERYNCPRFTAADENGCVILDYAIAIEG